MNDCQTMLMGLRNWIRTVAFKFASRGQFIEQEDYEQEAAMSILRKGSPDEALAKVVAIRAMRKLRDSQGLERVTGRNGDAVRKPLKRRPLPDDCDSGAHECDGIFWDNLKQCLGDDGEHCLREWLSGRTAEDISRATGVPSRTVRDRIERSIEKVRERWLTQC